jgi:hypothetical protein
MSDPIMSLPMLILETRDEVAAAIDANLGTVWKREPYPFAYRIKSHWLIEVIREIVAEGKYPYNSTVKKRAEEQLGLPPRSEAEYSTEGDTLSLLIYNAQCYRDSDDLIAAGFEYGSEDLLQIAHESGRRIETRSGTLLTVREVDGKLYAFKPRARKLAVDITGVPVRLQSVGARDKCLTRHSRTPMQT